MRTQTLNIDAEEVPLSGRRVRGPKRATAQSQGESGRSGVSR